MKSFFVTLFLVCGIAAAAWFLYDPYIEPLLEGESADGPTLTESDTVIGEEGEESGMPAESPGRETSADEREEAGSGDPSSVAWESGEGGKEETELDRLLEERYPMPDFIPLEEIVNDWRDVPKRAYPKEVTLDETISFELVVDGQRVGASEVAPGTPLQPVELDGDQLTIANPTNPAMSKRVAVEKTDFKERIRARYDDFVESKRREVMARRERVREAVEADPSKMAYLTGEADAGTGGTDGNEARFAPVKRSLRNGEAASVKLEEANSFRWNGEEKVGGEYAGTYETVTVNFVVSTIFGEFPVEYKALLRGGEVVAWIDPLTGDRI